MKIRDILAEGRPTLSFEVFPPKTEDRFEAVEGAALAIAELKPSFMSVTYGAGGGTSRYTVEIASAIKDRGVTPLAHLTCVSSTREKVRDVLGQLRERGIENVLALRGDIPSGRPGGARLPLRLGADRGDPQDGRFLYRRGLLSGGPCGVGE